MNEMLKQKKNSSNQFYFWFAVVVTLAHITAININFISAQMHWEFVPIYIKA